MNKISNVIEFVKARKEATNEEGFSLIELVVAVGILAILSVTGVVAYSQITDNARQTAVDAAAAEVFTAAVAYEADNDPDTTPDSAAAAYTASADGIRVTAEGSGTSLSVTAVETDRGENETAKTATRSAAN